MAKRILAFVVTFLVVTAALALLWQSYFKIRYPAVFGVVARPILAFAGVKDWRLDLVVGHFATWIPYSGLLIASRWLIGSWKEVLQAWLLGFLALVVCQLLLSAGVYYCGEWCGTLRTFYLALVPMYLFNDCLPILLWLCFFHNEVPTILGGSPNDHGNRDSSLPTES